MWEKNHENEVVQKEGENKLSEDSVKGDNLDRLIDWNWPLRRTKKKNPQWAQPITLILCQTTLPHLEEETKERNESGHLRSLWRCWQRYMLTFYFVKLLSRC